MILEKLKKLIDQICNEVKINNLSLMQSGIYVSVDSTRATRVYVMELTLPDLIFNPNKPNTYHNSNEEYINKSLSKFLQHLLTVNQDEDYKLDIFCRKM